MDSRYVLPVHAVLDHNYSIERVLGTGGFGITYAAKDLSLGTTVALKEYYPVEFGDRDSTMSVGPKSERHKETFEWGRVSFLEEARMLARFRHPSVVRVSRVFEANGTAYMVMDFEPGKNLEDWLTGLRRPPTQAELDRIAAPLLEALELMHAGNFLHRDIAPDNIVVRPNGTPVLLDFGAARRSVAEMSRTLTRIVKAGYSPQEQYAADNRLQGPWSDLYALGATLYRAVTGRPPEEASLRASDDRTVPATTAATGKYRQAFLEAIDRCIRVRHKDRPQSVAELRPLLLGPDPEPAPKPQPKPQRRPDAGRPAVVPTERMVPPREVASGARAASWRWLAAAAALILVAGAAFVALQFASEPEERRKLEEQVAQQRRRADAAERYADEEARRRKQERDAAESRTADLRAREAEAKRQADAAAARARAEEERRREEEKRRAAGQQVGIAERLQAWIEHNFLNDNIAYSDMVDWYDQGLISRDAVLKDRAKYLARWPERQFTLVPGSIEITPQGANRYAATFEHTYVVRSEPRNAQTSGKSRVWLELEMIGGQPHVARQREVTSK